jgi:hypothetical protein
MGRWISQPMNQFLIVSSIIALIGALLIAWWVAQSGAFVPDAKSCEYMINGNWRINSLPTECLAEALEARKK